MNSLLAASASSSSVAVEAKTMCNSWCLDFARDALGRMPASAHGLAVLEVGSRIVNGSVREVFLPRAEHYLGVDLVQGPGVDRVLSVYDLTRELHRESQDLVLSTEMLEHCADWRKALQQLVGVLRVGGLLLVTTRSPGFALHDWPEDHWRFSRRDIERILAPVGDILLLEDDCTLGWPCGIGVLLRRTADEDVLAAWKRGLEKVQVPAVDPVEDAKHRPPGTEPVLGAGGDLRDADRAAIQAAAQTLSIWVDDPRAQEILQASKLVARRLGRDSALPSRDEIARSFEYLPGEAPFRDDRLLDPGVLTALYVVWANRTYDVEVRRLRDKLDGQER
jgi:SAM-dependent methyltransferase